MQRGVPREETDTVASWPIPGIRQVFVDHPIRAIASCGLTKLRYRGLARNAGQTVTLFALDNFWLACRQLLLLGRRCAIAESNATKPTALLRSP